MSFFPKSAPFFDMFCDLSKTLHEASSHLSQIKISGKTNRKHILAVQKLELKGDEITHRIKHEADSSFITPIDREDIHALSRNLNNVLDYIENVTTSMMLLDVKKNGQAFTEYCELIEESSKTIVELIEDLSYKGTRIEQMKVSIKLLHDYEKKGDQLTRNAIGHLFSTQKNAISVVKWKHIYDNLELILDTCEEVADCVDQIIIKNY